MITPKTNWTPNDYINIEDYNRIIFNLWHITNELLTPYYDFDVFSDGDDSLKKLLHKQVDYNDYPTADRWNLIENTIEKIVDVTGGVINAGNKKIFVDGGAYIDFNELNRIESFTVKCQELYNSIVKKTLPFTLGTYGGIQV